MKTQALLLLFLVLSFMGNAQVLEDKVYADHILSVRMFPNGGDVESQLNAPVVSLTDSKSLVVWFDDVSYDPGIRPNWFTAMQIGKSRDCGTLIFPWHLMNSPYRTMPIRSIHGCLTFAIPLPFLG